MPQFPDLPEDIESRLLRALDAPNAGRLEEEADSLCKAHPEHATRIRAFVFASKAQEARAEQELRSDSMPAEVGIPRIQGFEIVRRLGKGGFGEVFLARQLRPIRRLVALKVLLGHRTTEFFVGRFTFEQQALARMQHPNVAQVFEAGLCEDGRPYFAMEYVEGEPLLEYADKNRLGKEARLQLFLQACSGVQHAHQQGVIHRDLTPGNVLITQRDGAPSVKIIDFGLARAMEPGIIDDPGVTLTGSFCGTPPYMSPEQVDDESGAPDTRTDVYSLGAILYQFMTGVVPLPQTVTAGIDIERLIHAIKRVEPKAMSDRLAGDAERAEVVAGRQRTTRARLVSGLRGDLDWIVAAALRKDRRERFPSVSHLADDIQRHLRSAPVSVGPPSLYYQIRKLLRRYRVQAAVASTLLLVLVFGLLGTSLGFARAERAVQRFDQLAHHVRLAEAKSAADAVLPARPENSEKISRWVETHGRPKREALPTVTEALRTLREGARRENGVLVFATVSEQYLFESLTEVRKGLEAFLGSGGLFERMQEHLKWSQDVERLTLTEHSGEWETAIAEVAKSERYGGLRLTKQIGLVPLGPDPKSGLQEFLDLRSAKTGSRMPVRSNGRLLVTPDLGIVFVLLPGGTARFREEESPTHEVMLRPFFLGKYEITRAQWERMTLGMNPSQVKNGELGEQIGLTNPVDSVDWFSASAVLREHGMILPTDVQWEYACRAGTTTFWFSGDEVGSLERHANVADQSAKVGKVGWDWIHAPFNDGHILHAPVGSYEPNAMGFHDMHGNVQEWCRDAWDAHMPPPRPGDGLTIEGSDDPTVSQVVIARGGSFWHSPKQSGCGERNHGPRLFAQPYQGVRAARLLAE